MRSLLPALAGAMFLALGATSGTNAQVIEPFAVPPPAPIAVAPPAPFCVPRAGLDAIGRPYALQGSGAYLPYDGFGYPVVVNTVGTYAGVPVARTAFRYVPVPPALAPLAPAGPPVPVALLP